MYTYTYIYIYIHTHVVQWKGVLSDIYTLYNERGFGRVEHSICRLVLPRGIYIEIGREYKVIFWS